MVAVLGEYDALDGLSQKADCLHRENEPDTELDHGCGHQALGTGALGAVLGIKRFLEDCKIQGTVVYYGCPAEEGGSGKSFMVRDGVFDDVDCAFTWHPCDSTDLFSGRTLAVIGVTYHFTGVSAHAAGLAHIGRSALDAVELMNVGANYLREHVPRRPGFIMPLQMPAGSPLMWCRQRRACSIISGHRSRIRCLRFMRE